MEDVTWTIMLRVLFGGDTPDPGPAVRAAVRTALAAINQRIWALYAPPVSLPTARNRHFRQALHTLDTFVAQHLTQRRRPGSGPADLVTRLVEVRDAETGEAMRA